MGHELMQHLIRCGRFSTADTQPTCIIALEEGRKRKDLYKRAYSTADADNGSLTVFAKVVHHGGWKSAAVQARHTIRDQA